MVIFGRIQKEIVRSFVSCRLALLGICTLSFVPSNQVPRPKRPVGTVCAPLSARPWFALPDESFTSPTAPVHDSSSNFQKPAACVLTAVGET